MFALRDRQISVGSADPGRAVVVYWVWIRYQLVSQKIFVPHLPVRRWDKNFLDSYKPFVHWGPHVQPLPARSVEISTRNELHLFPRMEN